MRILTLALFILVFAGCGMGAGFDEDHMASINGTRLHFRVRGADKQNPYLLILHGGPGSSALEFYPWGRLLEAKVNVVYLDQRGSGLSQRRAFAKPGEPTRQEAEPFRFENQIADIEGVRRALGVNRWYVLGHSFGGMVGLEYITAHAEHVLGYIHMNGLTSVPALNEAWLDYAERSVNQTAATASAEDQTRIRQVLANVARLRTAAADVRDRDIWPMVVGQITPERLRDRTEAANVYDRRIDEEVLKRYGIAAAMLRATEPGDAMGVVEAMATRDVTPLFDDVHVPVLILSGDHDPIIPTAGARQMSEAIPQSRLTVIAGAGHEIYKDQPEPTAEAVLAFIAAQVLPAGVERDQPRPR